MVKAVVELVMISCEIRVRKLSVYWHGKTSKVCYKSGGKNNRQGVGQCEWYAAVCVKGGVEYEHALVFAFLRIKELWEDTWN